MEADDKEELNALVVGFLTSSLKENPSGFELRHFERLFPEKTEEPLDWYKRYGMSSPLDALKNLGDSIRINTQRNGCTFVSLNTRSSKVDQHLVDLVQNQRPSGKRKRMPARSQTQRVLDSFAINRRSSNWGNNYSIDRYRSRLNHDSSYLPYPNQFVEKSVGPLSAPRPTIYSSQTARTVAPGDPRARQAPSQVRPTPPSQPFSSSGPPPTKQSAYGSSASPIVPPRRQSIQISSSSTVASTPSSTVHKQSTVPAALQAHESRPSQALSNQSVPRVDPVLESRRLKVKQRLLHLLNHKYPEIKMLYLPHLYEEEYDEPLDPIPLGFKTLTQVYQSFSDAIKIRYKSSASIISAVIGESIGKENIASRGGNVRQSNNIFDSCNASSNLNPLSSSCEPADNKENSMPLGRAKYNAIDPFNVATMLQSLEPLRKITEPPLGTNKLEDIVKYRTLRIIFKDPKMELKLEDWERKYQQEWNCSNRIQIRDYGYKTMLEFFKSLAAELPIKIRLKEDEWVAICDIQTLSPWLKDRVATGHYRAVTVIDAKYEHIAFPGDKYNYLDFKGLQNQPYYEAIKDAVMPAYKMCLQMGVQERNEDNITFETTSSCYNDYKRKEFFTVPDGFTKSGFPCAAFDDSEQRWCRAIVVKAPENITKTTTVSAFLVDYAITKSFLPKNLLCILKNHLKYPVSQMNPIIN